jgi:hypothetical protein
MGGTCSKHDRGKKFIQNLFRELERKRLLCDLCVLVDGRVILSRVWSDSRRSLDW